MGFHRYLWLIVAGFLIFLGACSRPDNRDATATRIIRLMPETTERLSSQAPIWEEREVFRWEFKTEADLAPWDLRRIGEDHSLKTEGLYIRPNSADPALVRYVSLDSSRVHAIRVVHSGLTSGAATQIYWTRPGEGFAEERSLSADHPDANGTLTPTFTFEVFRHDLWSETIDTFRLDPISIADRRMQINSVSGIQYVILDTLLNTAVEKAWRVDYTGDTRYAVLVPPSRPYTRELTIPKYSTLNFALGLPPELKIDVHFKVTWTPTDGTAEVLLEETVSPTSDNEAPGWHERVVDLERFTGSRGRLTFSTDGPDGLDLRTGLPTFSNISLTIREHRPSHKNVILIILDTLRADGLSCYGNEFDSSPRIDAWAKDHAVLFENTVAQAPWTLPSHVSIFTGMDPIHHSMNVGEPIDESLTTLAETLRRQGFATAAFTGGGYLSSEYALMQGFDEIHYFYEPQLRPRETGNDIGTGTDRTLQWLEKNTERPFFLLFHTYEIHAPYRSREPFLSGFLDIEPGSVDELITTGPVEPIKATGYQLTSRLMQRHLENGPRYEPIDPGMEPLVRALYASSVANADAHIGKLLDKLQELGLDDETVVVLTSDHGEALGENGLAGHATLQECEIMVPLIIAAPGQSSPGTRVTKQVQSINIAPTILDLLELKPLEEADGQSLVQFLSDNNAGDIGDAVSYAGSSNFGLSLRRANHLKYLINNSPWPATRGLERLYDLSQDPNATRNIAESSPETDALYQLVVQDFEQRVTGLRVHFVNNEALPMKAILKGWLVNPLRVKSFDITTDEIKWYNQRLNFTLAPKESVTFFIEGAVTGELLLLSRFEGPPHSRPPRLERTFDLDQLEDQWQAVLQEGAWVEASESVNQTESTLVRMWAGGLRSAVRSTGDVNEQTREQLRQLGYIVD